MSQLHPLYFLCSLLEVEELHECGECCHCAAWGVLFLETSPHFEALANVGGIVDEGGKNLRRKCVYQLLVDELADGGCVWDGDGKILDPIERGILKPCEDTKMV